LADCTDEPIVAVKKDKEKDFYNQLKTKFS